MNKTLKNIEVPTGNICVVQGELGKLECLSLGDYGKDINLNQHKKVEHTQLMPLPKKWVCTISTQYGCSSGCLFCDVPKCGPGVNATLDDLRMQVETVMSLHPEILECERFNVHYARMGEPTWNWNVIYHAILMKSMFPFFSIHPVVSTMMPKKNPHLKQFLYTWCKIKNNYYDGNAGLQLSINSTNDVERNYMFNYSSIPILSVSEIMKEMPFPKGRKYTLNFAIADYEIDARYLARLFDPASYICKLTPMHKTREAIANGIRTQGDYTESYPYEKAEEELKAAGFETLVFIASREEDESRITCGNAILADKEESL